MFETFENLPESRKNQILKICVEEFAKNGYKNTSTNTIVKRLGISKGVLFLYFKNKKNLYMYLVDRLTEAFTNNIFKNYVDQKKVESIDIFNYLGEYYGMLLKEDTYNFIFLLEANTNPPKELREEIMSRHSRVHNESLGRLSMEKVRKDINPEMAVDLLHIVSCHLGQMMIKDCNGELNNIQKNIDKYLKILDQYLYILKYGIFEQENNTMKKGT